MSAQGVAGVAAPMMEISGPLMDIFPRATGVWARATPTFAAAAGVLTLGTHALPAVTDKAGAGSDAFGRRKPKKFGLSPQRWRSGGFRRDAENDTPEACPPQRPNEGVFQLWRSDFGDRIKRCRSTVRSMGSPLFLSDLLTDHEPTCYRHLVGRTMRPPCRQDAGSTLRFHDRSSWFRRKPGPVTSGPTGFWKELLRAGIRPRSWAAG